MHYFRPCCFSHFTHHTNKTCRFFMKRHKTAIFLGLWIYLLAGCTSSKKVLYFQDTGGDYKEKISQDYELKILPDDLLSIMVNSKDAELVQMFNLPIVRYDFAGPGTGGGGAGNVLGYTVNQSGSIDFPQLGTIGVQGKTRSELATYIKEQLIAGGYVKDPVVTVQLLNFRVSVLGEVNRPGSFNLKSDRVSILDAISEAGDLTIYGKRDNVRVIREENGERSIATLDLKSAAIFQSPYYYLRQNDIVYIEPNKVKAGQSEINQNRSIGTLAAITSVLISLAVLIFK